MKKLISLLKAVLSQDMSLFKYKTKNNTSKLRKILFPVFLFGIVSVSIGTYAYMLADYNTIKILNLLTNESHNATGTIIHASGGLLDWPFEIIPNNSLWTVKTGSPSLVSLIQVSGKDETFESVSLDNYSALLCRIYDKQTQMFYNIVLTSTEDYLYKSLTDRINGSAKKRSL